MSATTVRTLDGYTLEEVVKAVLTALQPQVESAPVEPEEPEPIVPEVTTRAYGLEDYPVILSAKHVRAILGISEAKTYELWHRDDFPKLAIAGKRRLVRKEAFQTFMEEQEKLNDPHAWLGGGRA